MKRNGEKKLSSTENDLVKKEEQTVSKDEI